MKKLVFILLSALTLNVAFTDRASAQRVPDEEDILSKILSSDSPFYYPAMMARFLAGDLELTADHYFYLYYGFAYDDAYDAHTPLPAEDVILEIFARTPNPSHGDALQIIEAAKKNMELDPFNPGNLNMLTFAYGIVGDTINEIINAKRFEGVIGAITSSGFGTRENSPWHILRFSHANDVVASKGFAIQNRQVRSRSVEYIQLARNREGVRGFFFDFSRVYWKPFEGERVRRNSRWMLNDIPL